MSLNGVLEAIEPMEWLTIGLVVFAGAQVWLQLSAERQRLREKAADRDEAVDRAFHVAWAEHFRLEGLANDLERRDLVEMAYLGVLDPHEVLPRDWGRLTEALAGLSREAGFLGGTAVALSHDVARSIAILLNSVRAFAREAPPGMSDSKKVSWLREQFGEDLSPWEAAVQNGVTELSLLMWDCAKHNPRVGLERRLEFSDDLCSGFAKAAVEGLVRRSPGAAAQTGAQG